MTMPSIAASGSLGRANSTNSVSSTITITAGSGRVLVAFAFFYNTGASSGTVSSIVFDPGGGDEASFTNESGANAYNDWSSRRHGSEAWYLVLGDGVSNGSYTVTVTFSDSFARVATVAYEMADADTTDPVGASGAGTGTAEESSVDVTTTAANSLVMAGTVDRNNSNFTPGTNDDEILDDNQNLISIWIGSTDAASTSTYTVSASNTGTAEWAMSGVEIFEAAGGGPTGAPYELFLQGTPTAFGAGPGSWN